MPSTTTYSGDELRGIGERCAQRLPPASTVQAMFLYEMQRDSELERLFHGEIFRLAQKAEDASHDHQRRIQHLEEEMRTMQQRLEARDVNDRLATSKVRFDAQQGKIDELSAKFARFEAVTADIERVKLHNGVEKEHPPTNAVSELAQDISTIDEDIGMLFTERDALVTMLDEANMRIDKLEGLVRALTGQSPTTSSPALSQHLPIQDTELE